MKNKYLLPVSEASKVYGIGRDKFYQLIRSQKDIPIIKIGGATKINSILFEEWLNKCTREGRAL